MLFQLLNALHAQVSVLNVVRYITFRTAAASLTALALSLLLGPWLIRRLRAFQIGQVVRQDGPASHKPKAGTPTMGGLLILAAVFVPTLLWADLTNAYIWIALVATALFGAIGFVDDYLKITRHSHHGLFARYKFAAQVVVALAVGVSLLVLASHEPPLYNTRLIFPFFKNLIPDLGRLVRALRGGGPRECHQRRQPHRRPRRPRHRDVRRVGGGLHGPRLRHRQPRPRRIPAPRALLARRAS